MSLRTCRDCGYESDNLVEFKIDKTCLHGRANLCIKCVAKRMDIRRNKGRELIQELKSQPCARCGQTFPPCAMDFHHLEGSGKELSISKMISYNVETILNEIDKCIILCACCHRIIHHAKEEYNGNQIEKSKSE